MPYNVRFVSTYHPKRCGIAKYTENLIDGCSKHRGFFGDLYVTAIVGDEPSEIYTNPIVDIKIKQDDPRSWKTGIEETIRSAKTNNEILILQHEFGIAECDGQDYFVELAKEAKNAGLTVITYLHTVTSEEQKYIDRTIDLGKYSDKLVVHTESGKDLLEAKPFSISYDSLETIPHGVRFYHPSTHDRLEIKKKRGLENIMLLSSFGLRGPGKGNEYAIKAYSQLLETMTPEQRKRIVFGIFGECHKNFKQSKGGKEWQEFEEMIKDTLRTYRLNTPKEYVKDLDQINWVDNDVIVYDRFLEEDELLEFYCATNLMLMLYPGLNQISSGILADGMGTGTATIATLFEYAKEVLYNGELPEGFSGLDRKNSRGGLVKIINTSEGAEELNIRNANVDEAADLIKRLVKEDGDESFRGEKARHILEKRSLSYGRKMRWPYAAWELYNLIEEIEEGKERTTGRGVKFDGERILLPGIDF